VVTDASPEPYIGPLAKRFGAPRLIALGLNPGPADLRFQGHDGLFSREIADGRYSDWAVTAPYLCGPWRDDHRHNPYHERLLRFARRWTEDDTVKSHDILVFEMFPWHSDRVTAPICPDPSVIDRFIWKPLAEIGIDDVFAFGAPWSQLARELGLTSDEEKIALTVKSRRVETFRLPSGQRLIISWQPGYSGPPGPSDVRALREALAWPDMDS
jgi:hypothetical protein